MDMCTTANRKKQLHVNISQTCTICNPISTINIKSGPLYTQRHARKVRFITAGKQTTKKRNTENQQFRIKILNWLYFKKTGRTLNRSCFFFFFFKSMSQLICPIDYFSKTHQTFYPRFNPHFYFATEKSVGSVCLSNYSGKAENQNFITDTP